MASVGIGYKPLQRQKTEFFELPFNELLAGLSAKQKQFDEVDDTKNQMFDALLKVKPFYSSDVQYLQQYQNDLATNVDNIIDKYQGDLTKARPEIQKMARKINQDLTSGNLATINYNTAEASKILEDVAKAKQDKEFGQYSEVIGAIPNFYQRQQMQLQDALDEQGNLKKLSYSGIHRQANRIKEAESIFDPIKADLLATDYFNPKTGYQVKKSVEGIIRPKIYQTALQNLDALSPNLQAELDYQIKSGQLPIKQTAEEFIKAAYPESNAKDLVNKFSLEELQHYAKAYEIGKLGENRTFQKEQYGSTPNAAMIKLGLELEKEAEATKLRGFDNPIQTSPEIKTDFDNIKFDNGKLSTFNETYQSKEGQGVRGERDPFKGDTKQKTPKTPEQIKKEENFIKTLRSQFPELSKTITEQESKSTRLPIGTYAYNEEQVYNAWKQAKKNATKYYNSYYRFPDENLNNNLKKMMDDVIDTQPIYVQGSNRTDLTLDSALKELGISYDEFKKNKTFKGFNFSNENLPGIQYDIKVGDKIKTVIVGAEKDFRDDMELPRLLTGAIKSSIGTGEPQTFNFGEITYSVYPELIKTSAGWEFKPIVQVNNQFTTPDVIYKKAREDAGKTLKKK